jgi:RNA polymerase sigma-70 factor (ECF subfamily)
MATGEAFRALLRRVRAGDETAAAELVRQYEPAIRRAVRARLDARLGRLIDSVDICQSVLANFFVRFGAGQFEVEEPQQLLKLLVVMARNRVLDQARKQKAGRRDQRRQVADGGEALEGVAAEEATPSRVVASRELLHRLRQELSTDERFLADQRAQGREWAEIAAEVGAKPDALRMKLNRAVDRVARRLGLEEVAAD